MKHTFSQFLNEGFDSLKKEGRIIYHVSPVKVTLGDKWGNGYDELHDAVSHHGEDGEENLEEYELWKRTLTAYEKGMGNVSSKASNQVYVSSQPQAWIDVQTDELGITYKFGGIYLIITKHPVKEHLVPSGMGQQLPEAIINVSDIIQINGPFKSVGEADRSLQ